METNAHSNPNVPPPLNIPIQTTSPSGNFQLLFQHKAIYVYIILAAMLFIVSVISGTSFFSALFASIALSCFLGMLFALFRPNVASLGITQSRWKAAFYLFVMFVLFVGLSSIVETPQEKAKKNSSVARPVGVNPAQQTKEEPDKPRNESSITHNGIKYRAYVSSNVIISILDIESTKSISSSYSSTKASGIFKVVKIGAVNNQKDAITVDSNSFKLIDNQGREFSVSTEASTAIMMRGDEGFLLKQINPGIGVSGLVAFEVPNDTQIIKMRARGGMTGKPIDIPFRIDKM